MQKVITAAIAGLAGLALAVPVFADNNPMEHKSATLTGQVVDLSCFLSSGAHGPSHKACATVCAKAGGALGILTKDGSVVISIEPSPGKSANALLLPYVEESVTVTGTEFDSHGIKSIAISSVKPVDKTMDHMGH